MQKDQIIGDDKEVIGGAYANRGSKAPKDFPLKATLEWTSEEAEYLRRGLTEVQGSPLSYMVHPDI